MTGLIPDAHPTAPGGMNQKALREELRAKHGYEDAALVSMKWPELIDAVIEGRLEREKEARASRPSPLFIGMPDSQDFVFSGHSGAGPSGAERWVSCTASLAAAREFLETLSPNQQAHFAVANEAARQGTTAHAAAEVEARVILGQVTQEEANLTLMELAVLPESEGEAYDTEMAEYITEYVDLVKQYADARGAERVLIEERVEAVVELTAPFESGTLHTITGSTDFAVLPAMHEPTLVVGDLKYGNGIDVDVDQNPQIRIYALGILSLLVDEDGNLPELMEEVVYHIVQPRLGGIKTWSESIYDLLTWRDEVLSPALSLALAGPEGGATYEPSELACQWCPARGGCTALAEQRMGAAAELFDTIVEEEFKTGETGAFPETSSLTDERLGSLLAQIEGLTKIKDDLKAEAQRRLHRGRQVPGYQLVSYTPPRKWSEQAESQLEEMTELWSKKLITPTQALALLSKTGDERAIQPLIVTPDKRPVVAREGDRRKTWEGKPPEAMFADESEV